MRISIQGDEFIQKNISSEKIPEICDRFNQMEKHFLGFIISEKGWEVWIDCSGNRQIYILGDTITVTGLITRKYKVSAYDINEFVKFLEPLEGDAYENKN